MLADNQEGWWPFNADSWEVDDGGEGCQHLHIAHHLARPRTHRTHVNLGCGFACFSIFLLLYFETFLTSRLRTQKSLLLLCRRCSILLCSATNHDHPGVARYVDKMSTVGQELQYKQSTCILLMTWQGEVSLGSLAGSASSADSASLASLASQLYARWAQLYFYRTLQRVDV